MADMSATDKEGILTTDEPAIGLAVTPEHSGRVARQILDARLQGYKTIVVGDVTAESDWSDHARALDAVVIDRATDVTDRRPPRERLVQTARKIGFPGLILHEDPTAKIDYERSVEMLEMGDSYAVEARTEPAVDEATSVLVGIPAYEEAGRIGETIAGIPTDVDEVLVVDDGSEDGTAAAAVRAGASVVRHETNRGYGAALKTIFETAYAGSIDELVILDGDGQHDPADVTALLDALRESNADVVIGSRFVDGGRTNAPTYRRVGLFVVNVLTNLSLGVVRPRSWVNDTQSGYRAYSRRAIESLRTERNLDDGMSASTDILNHAHRNGYEIQEVGTTIEYGAGETSTRHPLKHGAVLVKNILTTVEQERPITVLGLPGVLSWFGALAFAYWTMNAYVSSGSFPVGLGLAAGFLGLLGLLACFTAIILHTLATHHD